MFDFSENSLSLAKMPKMQNGSYRKIQLRVLSLGKNSRAAPHSELLTLTCPSCWRSLSVLGSQSLLADVFAQGYARTQPAPKHAHWLLPFPKLLWHISADWSRKIWGSQGLIYLCMNACRCNLLVSPKQNIFTAIAKANLPKSNLFGG